MVAISIYIVLFLILLIASVTILLFAFRSREPNPVAPPALWGYHGAAPDQSTIDDSATPPKNIMATIGYAADRSAKP